jgi:hypothetical protein
MKKIIQSVMAAALVVGGGSLVELPTAHAQGSATVGSLRGVIRDKATGEPAIGATVVATSPSLVGEQVAITEAGGQYFITSLPPGVYTLTVYYNDATFSRGNVLIQLGKEAVVNVTIDSSASAGKPKGEVIEISGSAPIVDQGSTKTGMTVTDDYTRNIPVGRTFGAVLGSAAGSQSDNYGYSFNGATSAENTYIVEGINTTDTAYGGISSNLPHEFIQETEIITGGYNAEFGRATGGIVNVVTKQGSNEFHGSVFGYFQPGAFISEAKGVARQGGAISSQTDLDYRYDIGAEVGGPIIKDKLWFHVGFNPSFSASTTQRRISTLIDENQDGVPDVDENGFNRTELLSSSDIPRSFNTYFFTAKINGALDQNNQFQISAFGNPRTAEDVFGIVRNPEQTRYRFEDGAYDFSAKWTSKFNEGKTQIDAVVGYHHGFSDEQPWDASQNVPYVYYNYNRSLYDFADLEGADRIARCQDGGPDDPYPNIVNCPVLQYGEQGLSYLESRTNTRTSAALSLTQRVKAAGYHVFKVGADVELATYDAFNRYSGGALYRRNSANSAAGAPGAWQLREFYERVRNLTPEEAANPSSVQLEPGQVLCANDLAVCARSEGVRADTNNRSIAAFIQDSWQVMPNLTLNLGLRWEQQIGYVAEALQGQVTPEGEIVPEEAYRLDNLLAPRIGFIYDPTREGKSKIFGHYGLFYENVPMDINVRAMGGEITGFTAINPNRRTPSSGAYDPNCDVDHMAGQSGAEIVSRLDQCSDRVLQAVLGGGYEYVSPGLRGQRTDEIILGAEYEFMPNFKLGANYIHRSLPVVIEDISVDGGNTYLITNPGFDFSDEAAKLEAEAQRLMMSSDPQDVALGHVYQGRADSLKAVGKLQKPVRSYDALQLVATQRPTKQSLVIASYTYSRSKGNFPGLFSTETGQLDPNLTSMYDLPALMANRYGPMGLDRPHNIKIDGFYAFDLKKAGQIILGGSFRGQSGIAHNVLGAHPIYGNGESYLLKRGANERSPFTTQFDARLSYGYRVSKTTMVEAFVNVFNLFNSQEQLNVDENYTYDFVNPIIGGDFEDLRHIKTVDGFTGQELNQTPVKNRNFNNTGGNNVNITNVIQAPRALQLGFRVTF